MNDLDILDIKLLCYLVDEEIRRCENEDKLFDLRLLQHKLKTIRNYLGQ